MNKEYFLRLCTNYSDGFTSVDTDDLNKFFDSNVCIPKGENRHLYADIIHEWCENITSPLQYEYEGKWYTDYPFGTTAVVYRIKPSEPEFEYQYVFYDKDKEIARSSFLTEHEYDISCLSFEWLIDIKSKRVRQ